MGATAWQDAVFERFERAYATSIGTARARFRVGNEYFAAYLKPLGNPEGPHVLACEWVGTHLAHWLGLVTFDFGIVRLDETAEVPLGRGGNALPGPAFVTRAETGHAWSGSAKELETVVNMEDITRLVVLDTWTLNCDRHFPDPNARQPNRDNVFLVDCEGEPGRTRLVAMDHTHCFTCGRPLDAKLARIDRVKDQRIFGLFPDFIPLLDGDTVRRCQQKLRSVDPDEVRSLVATIPAEWQVDQASREALVQFLCQRAVFLGERLGELLRPHVPLRQGELPFPEETEP